MKMKESMDCAEQLLLKTYNRYQVVPTEMNIWIFLRVLPYRGLGITIRE